MAKEVTEILEAMTAEDLKRRREIAEKLFSEHFSSHEARKTFIREFAAELREARKNAVETGNRDIVRHLDALVAEFIDQRNSNVIIAAKPCSRTILKL